MEKKIDDRWIPVSERSPAKTGLYKIKTESGTEGHAPYSRTLRGNMVWVVPESAVVTHWKNI